jgi:uncharacterized protein with HEPN domain
VTRRDYRHYLADLLTYAEEAVALVAGRSDEAIRTDRIRRLALERCIEIIGEAAAKVPAEVQRRHPDLPWATMRGIRNRLAHGYFAVDMSILVATAREDLPPLIPRLRHLVAAEADQPDEPGQRSDP